MKDNVYECLVNNGQGYNKLSEMNQIEFQLFMLFLGLSIHRYEWENLPSEIPSWCLEKVINLYGQGVLFEVGGQYLVTSAVNSSLLNIYNEPCQVQPVAMNGMTFPLVNVKDNTIINNDEMQIVKQNGVLIKNNVYSIPTYAMLKPFIKKLCFIWESAGINASLSRIVALIQANKDVAGSVRTEISKIIGSKSGIAVVNEKMNTLEMINKVDLRVDYMPDKYWQDFDNTFNMICQLIGLTTDMNKNKKERVVVAQVESNDEVTSIICDSYLEYREQAVDEMNKLFGLGVKVYEKKDIKTTNPNDYKEPFDKPTEEQY